MQICPKVGPHLLNAAFVVSIDANELTPNPFCSPKCFKEKHEASKVKVRREDSVARADSGEDDPPGTRPRMDSVGNKTSVKGMFGADQSGPKRSQKSFRVKSGERLKEGQYTRQPVRTLPVYDLAPDVRPLVIVGPSAPGYEVTDKMQYALVSYLLMSFSQHCVKVLEHTVLESVGNAFNCPLVEFR